MKILRNAGYSLTKEGINNLKRFNVISYKHILKQSNMQVIFKDDFGGVYETEDVIEMVNKEISEIDIHRNDTIAKYIKNKFREYVKENKHIGSDYEPNLYLIDTYDDGTTQQSDTIHPFITFLDDIEALKSGNFDDVIKYILVELSKIDYKNKYGFSEAISFIEKIGNKDKYMRILQKIYIQKDRNYVYINNYCQKYLQTSELLELLSCKLVYKSCYIYRLSFAKKLTI